MKLFSDRYNGYAVFVNVNTGDKKFYNLRNTVIEQDVVGYRVSSIGALLASYPFNSFSLEYLSEPDYEILQTQSEQEKEEKRLEEMREIYHRDGKRKLKMRNKKTGDVVDEPDALFTARRACLFSHACGDKDASEYTTKWLGLHESSFGDLEYIWE
jgi:hypothetical protein